MSKGTNVKLDRGPRAATLPESLIMFAITILIILISIVGFGTGAHIPLFFVCVIATLYAMLILGYKWATLENAIIESVKIGIWPCLFMILIGMTIGGWIAGGTVPYLIYLGLQAFSPQVFLVATLIMCSVMSLTTGSSWTTMGTLGVALVGVGYGLGINPALTAGAIISGAYFGDKLSPISETTVFAAGVAEVGLFTHVRSMFKVGLPAWIISALAFLIIGYAIHAGGAVDTEAVDLILSSLSGAFWFNPILLIPPIVVITLIVKKVPAMIALSIAAILGFIFSIAFQGVSYPDILNVMYGGYVGNTDVAAVDRILTRGGIVSMFWSISMVFLAMTLGGIFETTKTFNVLLNAISGLVKTVFGAVATALAGTFIMSAVLADTYTPMLLVARTLKPAFDKLKLNRAMLSRSIETTGTLGSPFIPWTTNGLFVAGTLGVTAFAYAPYFIYGYVVPIVALLVALIGKWGVDRIDEESTDVTEEYWR